MKNNKYTFGDVTFEVELPVPLSDDNNCVDFLSERNPDYTIRILIVDEVDSNTSMAERNGNQITRFFRNGMPNKLAIASLFADSKVAFVFPDHDAFILHASYILYKGKAVLFTAPSGTGKTTQAQFWRDVHGAEIINGDRVLVTKRNGIFYANGIYASGTSGICKNITAPVGAVVLLEQGEHDEILPIPPRMLFLRILCECSYDLRDSHQCEKITELVSDMINALPAICYRCTKSPDAAVTLERILWNRQ